MTDYHRSVLSHYNLSSPFPAEWPAEKDQTDAPPQEISLGAHTKLAAQSRRYSVLDCLGAEGQTILPRSGRDGPERENAVQTDEPDPLGASDSVVGLLRQRGLPVDNDAQLSKGKNK